MNPIDELEDLLAKATPRPWQTDASAPNGSWPYTIETPEGGRIADDIEESATADLIVASVHASPTFVRLARTASRTLAAAGPLTFTPPGQDHPCCLFCGAPVNSGDCCLDEMRAVLRELNQERSPV